MEKMTFRFPDWLDDIWAKSAEQGAGRKPETLAQHTWSVLECLADMIDLRPSLPQRIGVPNLWNLLFWSVFLHDFGKSASGFQEQLRANGKKWKHRHEVLSLAFVDWIAEDLTHEEKSWIVAGIVSHHKEAYEICSLYIEYDDPDDDPLVRCVAEINETSLIGLWRWLDECSNSWIGKLGLSSNGVYMPKLLDQKLAVSIIKQKGANRIHHWLKIYKKFIRQIEESNNRSIIIGCLSLRGHIINSDHSASAHAGAIRVANFSADSILESRNLSRDNMFIHQVKAGLTDGSAILIAPTGSGKTEAALLWVARQAEITRNVPRLFYTLPYQASMNAMMIRLDESFPSLVGLQHGRSLLALYRLLLDKDYDPKTAERMAKWAKNLAMLNYPPIRVLSPYQILKAMYRLKGYEALLNDYHDAVFIFDEIHAYEIQRLAMILKTIDYLKNYYNARFLIMSATFPSIIKEWLKEVLSDPIEIVADKSIFQAFCRHKIILHHGEILSKEAIKAISDDALSGKSVLVVCNIVDRAQRAYHELKKGLANHKIEVLLLHGKFNMRDRSKKERIVRDATGSKSENRRPIVLVSTQVVEVSLDIDLDTIYTDPAPLEALLQRFGRINRRRKQSAPALVHVYRQPDDGQVIYDAELVRRTMAILEREDNSPINEGMVGSWLDEIYSDKVAENLKSEFRMASGEFDTACINTLKPFSADEKLEEKFNEAFDGYEVLPSVLYNEYKSLSIDDPIRSNELLVSISSRQYHVLKNKNRVCPFIQGEPLVIEAQYNSEIGLTLDNSPIQEE